MRGPATTGQCVLLALLLSARAAVVADDGPPHPTRASGGVLPALLSAAVVADDGPTRPTRARPGPAHLHRPDGAWPYVPPAFPNGCLGEFSFCSRSKACVLDSANASACAVCGAGEYLCPDWRSCAPSAQAYADCPGIAGSHLDPSLPEEARLDALVARTNLSDWVGQMRTNAPAIPKAAVPAYNWLNDDLHAVMGPHATVFPDGAALGASWSRELLWEVGRAVGTEARGAHAGFTHDGDRGSSTEGTSGGYGENGMGITLYGPSVNLVRDPRCEHQPPLFPRALPRRLTPLAHSVGCRGQITGGLF